MPSRALTVVVAAVFTSSGAWAADGPTPPPAAAPAPDPPSTTRGWIGIGGRNSFGLGGAVQPDFGAYAYGGLWLLGEHVQPFARAGWTHAGGDGVTVNAVRFGAGLAAGAALLRDRLWLGGGVEIEAVGAWSSTRAGSGPSWGAPTALVGLVQGRIGERFLLGVDVGPELYPSPMRFAGSSGAVEWGPVRFNAGLLVGIVLGPPMR
jgi:hypothetical protein